MSETTFVPRDDAERDAMVTLATAFASEALTEWRKRGSCNYVDIAERIVPKVPTKRRRVELFDGANVFASFHHHSAEFGPLFHSWSDGVQSGASWTVAAILYTYCDNMHTPRPDQIAIVNRLAELAANPDEAPPHAARLSDAELTALIPSHWYKGNDVRNDIRALLAKYHELRPEVSRNPCQLPVYGYAVREAFGAHVATYVSSDYIDEGAPHGGYARENAERRARELRKYAGGEATGVVAGFVHVLLDGGPVTGAAQ